MKNSNLFIGGIIFILVVIFFLSSCSNRYQTINTPRNLTGELIVVQYDTVICVWGDTLLYKKPPKLAPLEKAGLITMIGVAIYVANWAYDEQK